MFKLTPKAAEKVKDAARQSNSEGMYLRVTARPGDAGSILYGMGFDHRRDGDVSFVSEGVTIAVTPSHLPLLNDAALDLAVLSNGDTRFVFVNPNDYGCFTNLGACGLCSVKCRPACACC